MMEIATGATIGGVIASSILGFELFGAGSWFERGGRRLPLVVAMLLRTIVYGAVIMAALLVVPWLYSGDAPSPLRPGMVGDVVFSIAATFVFVSLTSIAQVIGPNVLGNLLTGRYYHPREERRIVLFLDLVGSTAIAEDIGNVRFHALLSDTFTRLSRVVTEFGGEVYRYVRVAARLAANEEADRRCAVCDTPLPTTRAASSLYCSPRCNQAAFHRRRKLNGHAEPNGVAVPRAAAQGPETRRKPRPVEALGEAPRNRSHKHVQRVGSSCCRRTGCRWRPWPGAPA
jgi:hypothetical protein